MIRMSHVSKTFKIAKRDARIASAIKSLFKKEYTLVRALDDISFSIEAGEIVGYIGPNGAGKSTTIKIMCGILAPDGGDCVINGCIPNKNRTEYVKNIGVVFGQRSQLWWDVPVLDSFELIRDIYKIPPGKYRENLELLLSALDIRTLATTPARQLSLGQRMRCEIAASLLHDPQILFLDEPTIGLDAISKIQVRKFIREINQTRRVTVILTTHDMQDIEALTNRIILIGKGRILFDGSMSTLRTQFSDEKTITVDYSPTQTVLHLPGCQIISQTDSRAVLTPDSQPLSSVIAQISAQVDIRDMRVVDAPVEEVIAKMYEKLSLNH